MHTLVFSCLQRRTDEAADEAAGKLQDAKNTSVHKVRWYY